MISCVIDKLKTLMADLSDRRPMGCVLSSEHVTPPTPAGRRKNEVDEHMARATFCYAAPNKL